MKNRTLSTFRLPDYLSLFRIFAAVGLLLFAIYDMRIAFSWLLTVGFISDALDGFIARKWTKPTERGAQLDSLGDAVIYFAAAVGVIFFFEPDFFFQHLFWLAVAVGLYLLQLSLAFFRYGKPSSFHTYSAKTAAVVQGIFFVCTGFFEPWEWLFYIAIGITIIETLEEIVLLFVFKEPVTDVKGIYWVKKRGKETFK